MRARSVPALNDQVGGGPPTEQQSIAASLGEMRHRADLDARTKFWQRSYIDAHGEPPPPGWEAPPIPPQPSLTEQASTVGADVGRQTLAAPQRALVGAVGGAVDLGNLALGTARNVFTNRGANGLPPRGVEDLPGGLVERPPFGTEDLTARLALPQPETRAGELVASTAGNVGAIATGGPAAGAKMTAATVARDAAAAAAAGRVAESATDDPRAKALLSTLAQIGAVTALHAPELMRRPAEPVARPEVEAQRLAPEAPQPAPVPEAAALKPAPVEPLAEMSGPVAQAVKRLRASEPVDLPASRDVPSPLTQEPAPSAPDRVSAGLPSPEAGPVAQAVARLRAAEPVAGGRGSNVEIFGNDPATKYQAQFRVVPLDQLEVNAPEVQPRNRAAAASRIQVADIAAKLDADRYLSPPTELGVGPAIIGPDLKVESGNGRVMAMRLARISYPDQWHAFQERQAQRAAEFGIEPTELAGMRDPVIVRERLSNVDRRAFADEANIAPTAARTPFEVARSDGATLPGEAASGLHIGETQTLDQALQSGRNTETVQAFLRSIPPGELGQVVTTDGRTLTPGGLQRLKAALVARTFPGAEGEMLLRAIAEGSADEGIKNVQTGTFGALARLAKVRELVAQGERPANLDPTRDVLQAMQVLHRLRAQGALLEDYQRQIPLGGKSELSPLGSALLEDFYNARSQKAVRDVLNGYADQVIKLGDQAQQNLGGGPRGAADPVRVLEAGRPARAQFGLPGILRSERGAAGARPFAAETAARAEGISPPGDLPDKAGNINLARIESADDVKRVLVDVAEHEGGFLGARRGVISLEETGKLADELGLTPERLLKRRRGQALNAEQAVAARRLLVDSATDVAAQAKKYVASRAEIDLIAFEKAIARDTMIQEQVAGFTAEAGRALSSFRILASAQKTGRVIREAAATAGRTGPERAAAIADALAGFETGSQVHSFLWGATRPKLRNFLYYVWINGLLSGPKTHAVNIISNLGTALWTVPESAIASLGGNVAKREAAARLQGMVYGAREGLIAAGRQLKGAEPDLFSKLETSSRPGGLVGSTIGLPGRLLEAEDAVFKAINYRAEIYAQAERTAHTEGLKGAEGRMRVAELVAAPTEDMTVAAAKAARELTFQRQLGPMGAAFMRLADQIPGGRVVLPFIRTPANILRFATEASPLAPLLEDVRAKLRGDQGPAARDLAVSRMTLGSAVAATAAALAAEGRLSGDGPANPQERRTQMLNGWQPNSIRVGDTWYSYGRVDPYSMLLSVTANAVEVWNEIPKTDQEKIAALIVSSLAKNLTNKTYLRGLSDMIAAVHDPDQYGERWVSSLVGTVVPTGVAEYTRSTDPYLREARTLLDSIKARVPGQSEKLPRRIDLLGNPIRQPVTFGPTGLSPINQSQEGTDPAARALVESGAHPSPPQRLIRGTRLTGEQYEAYSIEAGRQLRELIEANIRSPGWDRMSPDEQKTYIDRMATRARAGGRATMMRRFPALAVRPTR